MKTRNFPEILVGGFGLFGDAPPLLSWMRRLCHPMDAPGVVVIRFREQRHASSVPAPFARRPKVRHGRKRKQKKKIWCSFSDAVISRVYLRTRTRALSSMRNLKKKKNALQIRRTKREHVALYFYYLNLKLFFLNTAYSMISYLYDNVSYVQRLFTIQ